MKKLASVFGYISAAATVLAFTVLAVCCADIYIKGNLPSNLSESGVHLSPVYTREIVARYLDAVAPVLAVCALVVLTALVFHSLASQPAASLPINEDYRLRLARKRVGQLPEEAKKQEALRRRIGLLGAAAILLCALPPLAFLLNGDNFRSWELDMVLSALLTRLLPWLVLAFAIALAASLAVKKSMLAELEFLRGCPSAPRTSGEDSADEKGKAIKPLRGLALAVALLFILLGVMNGGARDVLIKAVNICTECIGLG